MVWILITSIVAYLIGYFFSVTAAATLSIFDSSYAGKNVTSFGAILLSVAWPVLWICLVLFYFFKLFTNPAKKVYALHTKLVKKMRPNWGGWE